MCEVDLNIFFVLVISFIGLADLEDLGTEVMASRRAINPSRRVADSGSIPLFSSLHQKSRTSSLLPIGLVVLVCVLDYNVQLFFGFVNMTFRFGVLYSV